MPFKKGDPKTSEYARLGLQARAENKTRLWEFIARGGADTYNEKLDKLSKGEELSKPEEQFMDRVERLFPYIKGKPIPTPPEDPEGKQVSKITITYE